MKILIIGKKGQLAQSLTRILRNTGIQFRACSQQECDVKDNNAVKALIIEYRPTIVINTSAYNLVTEAEAYPEEAFAINTFAVFHLAQHCHHFGIRFVTYSTDYVFNGKKNTPYIESDPPDPLQMYGLSKFAGELASRQSNPDSIIIRTNGLYGGKTGSPQKHGNFVLQIIENAANESPIEVSDELTVNPTYSDDLAAATIDLLKSSETKGVYHLASEGKCTWYSFAKYICEMIGSSAVILPAPKSNSSSLTRPSFSVLLNTRARALNIVLPHWKTSVKEYISEIAHL